MYLPLENAIMAWWIGEESPRDELDGGVVGVGDGEGPHWQQAQQFKVRSLHSSK